MQPKFTLNTMRNVLTKIIAFTMIFFVSAQVSFGQKTEAMRNQASMIDADFNPPVTEPVERFIPKMLPSGVIVQRVNAPTVINAPGTMNNGNAQISFNFTNTNGFAVLITDIASVCFGGGAITVSAYYKPGAITGNPGPATPGNGWTLFGTNNITAVALPLGTVNPTPQTFFTGLSLNIPAGATYGIIIGTSTPVLGYMNSTAAGSTFSNGGCSVFVGGPSGWGGPLIPGNPVNNPRAFIGSVTFDQAVCIPNNATQPIISSVPSNTCAGSPITLSVIAGTLNGAANWVWYAGGCAVGAPVGTGNSISVSPIVTTTYFVRGEGGCAPAPGPCGQQTVTVTPCTCLTPDVATICSGSVQMLTVTPNPTTTQTFSNPAPITINNSGNATPYPSNIAVGGLPTAGVYVQSVTLTGFGHTWPGDVDIALRSPSGQIVILMSDIGDAAPNGVSGRTIIFNDAGPTLPAPIPSGTFKPTNAVGTFGPEPDQFPAPGPGGVTQPNPALSMFSSSNDPNGNWQLLVRDDFAGDAGTISGGWSITFRIVPTASWTSSPAAPNTMFTNPAATVPYVAGSQADAIWVNPTSTTTYTATFAAGPCAPTQTVTVNVLPRPNIVITPNPGGCAPVTLTASGGIVYTWTPGTALSATTGATVTATPQSDQVYTVLSYGANGCSNTASVPVKGISIASTMVVTPPALCYMEESFNGANLPAGWSQLNLSNPIGTGNFSTWHQGTTGGVWAPNSPPDFREVAFLSGSGLSEISNWLISPEVVLEQGNVLTFYSISLPGFPDRMQIRLSTNGASTNVGANEFSVGDFTNLLLDINPGLTLTGYPSTWTKFTVTLSSAYPPGTTGRFAFRYFVQGGGPFGANSNVVGLDDVKYCKPLPGLCPNTTQSFAVNITGGISPYTLVYTNGTSTTTFPGYTSGTLIQVSPAVTTTYTVVNVIGANGCPGIGNTGSATITVIQPPAITSQPASVAVCVGGSTTFTAGATPAVVTTSYQWQVSTDGGATWINLVNNATYSGVTTTSLTVTGITAGMNGYRYRLVVNGQCPPSPAISASATLQVNQPPSITAHPANVTVCTGRTATFTAAGTTAVGTIAYQWQRSVDGGITWANIAGATSATYSVTATLTMTGYKYRCVLTVAPCAATATSNVATLTVNPLPTVVITSADLTITPGQTTTINGTSSPAAVAGGWSWTLNGSVVPAPPNPPSTGPSISVGIDGLGVYQATATDANGCSNTSNLLTIGAEASDRLWIYPNPNDGNFQIRLYYDGNNAERRRIRIYNVAGQLVAQKEFDMVQGSPSYQRMDFALPRLAAGTYVAKVTGMVSGRIVSGLFVVAQ